MGIAFSDKQWDDVRKTYKAWWAQKLDRPVVPVWLANRNPGRPRPATPRLSQENCADLTIPAEAIIDRIDYELSQYTFLGDAYPFVNFDSFGPGVVAAFLGARLDTSSGRVWFHPEKILPISELHLEYDPDNEYLLRVRALYRAAMDRWGDQVLLSMPDLGGCLDILSTFRPGEFLLLDLVDAPDAVNRLTWEIHDLWHRFFDELSADLHGSGRPSVVSRGWTDWSGTFSDHPAYILQSDFSYMISPQMFDRFVRPELDASATRLGRAVYHLDGLGQLAHLDMILSIPYIKAVQWVPGDGKPPQDMWPEVYRKCHNAGKASLVYCGPDGLNRLGSLLGTKAGLCHMPVRLNVDQASEATDWLDLIL